MTKGLFGLTLVAGAAISSAENYVAKVYGSFGPFPSFSVLGAGDNGMMTGVAVGNGQIHAGTFTPQGFRDLHPTNFSNSRITNSWGGTYHVGFGDGPGGTQALFWVGGGQGISLHPSGAQDSRAYAVDGQWQAGRYNLPAQNQRACVWNRSAATFRALTTGNVTETCAFSIDTTGVPDGKIWVAGSGKPGGGSPHAVLWQHIDQAPTDLHVSGFTSSEAFGCDYPQIAGYQLGPTTGAFKHATVWKIGVPFATDLHPGNQFSESTALAVRNGIQVGFGKPFTQPSREQAILWHGSPNWTNLHSRLPYPYMYWSSRATDIDNLGNVVGYVTDGNNVSRPVIWERVN